MSMGWLNEVELEILRSLRIMKRDGYRCKKCRTDAELSIDHIDPDGGNEDENLQTLCVPCNRKKKRRPNAEFMAENAP